MIDNGRSRTAPADTASVNVLSHNLRTRLKHLNAGNTTSETRGQLTMDAKQLPIFRLSNFFIVLILTTCFMAISPQKFLLNTAPPAPVLEFINK